MAEVLGLAASTIGVVEAAAKTVRAASNTIRSIQNAPEIVRSTRSRLADLESVIVKLDADLKAPGSDLVFFDEINNALENCGQTCQRITSAFSEWTNHSTEDRISLRDKVDIGVLKRKRIEGLNSQLNDCKDTVSITLQAASYMKLARQEIMPKEMGDQLLAQLETIIEKLATQARTQQMQLDQTVQWTAVIEGNADEKVELFRELEFQRATNENLRQTCERARQQSVYERTGQRISEVSATNHSVSLAGYINAEEGQRVSHQDISNISADGYSISIAGVARGINIDRWAPDPTSGRRN